MAREMNGRVEKKINGETVGRFRENKANETWKSANATSDTDTSINIYVYSEN